MHDAHYAAVVHAARELEQLSGGLRPRALVVLGSGLSTVVDAMKVSAEAPFSALPGFAEAGVVGHAGKFVFGTVGQTPVMAMLGRLHLYEGHPAERVVLPVQAAAMLKCDVLVATNAAGGIGQGLSVGQTVMISDHINLLGANPLTGPNVEQLGPRFPAMSDAYSQRLRKLAHDVAAEQGEYLPEGVYAAVPGPNYETLAEVGYLRAIGADLVGMSTVPEVIAARHAGMEVAAFSLVANVAGDVGHGHGDVLASVEAGTPVMARMLTAILARL
jgi:purine-nucleoside phosphorylase